MIIDKLLFQYNISLHYYRLKCDFVEVYHDHVVTLPHDSQTKKS
jgi:hypothetical protein